MKYNGTVEQYDMAVSQFFLYMAGGVWMVK
jgi:hypothetical protein